MRREFNDETAIAVDLQTAGECVSRMLIGWMQALPDAEQAKAADLILDGGLRFGMTIVPRGHETPLVAIVAVKPGGELMTLAELDFAARKMQ